jgi:hypothetical protein
VQTAVDLTITTFHPASSRPNSAPAKPVDRSTHFDDVPLMSHPDARWLPDLVPTPAFQVTTTSHQGHDFMNFAATLLDRRNLAPGRRGVQAVGLERHGRLTSTSIAEDRSSGEPRPER